MLNRLDTDTETEHIVGVVEAEVAHTGIRNSVCGTLPGTGYGQVFADIIFNTDIHLPCIGIDIPGQNIRIAVNRTVLTCLVSSHDIVAVIIFNTLLYSAVEINIPSDHHTKRLDRSSHGTHREDTGHVLTHLIAITELNQTGCHIGGRAQCTVVLVNHLRGNLILNCQIQIICSLPVKTDNRSYAPSLLGTVQLNV